MLSRAEKVISCLILGYFSLCLLPVPLPWQGWQDIEQCGDVVMHVGMLTSPHQNLLSVSLLPYSHSAHSQCLQ